MHAARKENLPNCQQSPLALSIRIAVSSPQAISGPGNDRRPSRQESRASRTGLRNCLLEPRSIMCSRNGLLQNFRAFTKIALLSVVLQFNSRVLLHGCTGRTKLNDVVRRIGFQLGRLCDDISNLQLYFSAPGVPMESQSPLAIVM